MFCTNSVGRLQWRKIQSLNLWIHNTNYWHFPLYLTRHRRLDLHDIALWIPLTWKPKWTMDHSQCLIIFSQRTSIHSSRVPHFEPIHLAFMWYSPTSMLFFEPSGIKLKKLLFPLIVIYHNAHQSRRCQQTMITRSDLVSWLLKSTRRTYY